MNIHEQISLTKLQFATMPDTQFMFALCCKLKVIITEEVPTAATDGIHLYINENFFTPLTKEERLFLLAHETLHVAYLHSLRAENYDKRKFNMAADYVINDFLVQRNFKMIYGGLWNKKYRGLSTEEVYNLLDDSPQDYALSNDILPSQGDVDTMQVQQKVIEAVQHAQMTGKTNSIPEDIKRFVDELSKPKINWRAVLRRFLLEASKADYSWNKPNRRLLNQGFYLPSLNSQGLTKITFAIDVSISINDEMFSQFITEMKQIFKQLNPDIIEVIQFHHRIADISLVKNLSDFNKIQFKETGSTSLVEVMDYVSKTNSKALIVITDGYFYHDYINSKKPTLWTIFDNKSFKSPFGKVIHFSLKG